MDEHRYPFERISPVHARGLRRDLFRECEARTRQHWPRLQRLMANARLRHCSARDTLAVFDRTRAVMRACCYGFRANEIVASGIVARHVRLEHQDGGEDALALQLVIASLRTGKLVAREVDCARMSHHGVQRLFERLRTTDAAVVHAELVEAFDWMPDLYLKLAASARNAAVRQLPVPTKRGALLTERDIRSGLLNARTYMPRGYQARVDASVDTLLHWKAQARVWDDARRPPIEPVVDAPVNRWWWEARQPEPIQTRAWGPPPAFAAADEGVAQPPHWFDLSWSTPRLPLR